jgi:hypothetical protein
MYEQTTAPEAFFTGELMSKAGKLRARAAAKTRENSDE